MTPIDLAEEAERLRDAWSTWLNTLGTFAAETDPVRAGELAAEVARDMPFAVRSRLTYLELLPLEMRRRELAAFALRLEIGVREAYAKGCKVDVEKACAQFGIPILRHEEERPVSRGTPEVQAVMHRAAAGRRWRSPAGDEKTAIGVETGDQPVISGGHLVGIAAGPDGHFVAWSDGTRTPAREVADPRCGWKAILEVEER